MLTDKPIADANIYLGLFGGSEPYINITKTDSAGKYAFNGLDFTGENNLILSAADQNHAFKGWLFLDSIFGNPATVNYHWVYKPENIPEEVTKYKTEAEERITILKKYKFSDTVLMEPVVITAKKSENDDGHPRIYGQADYVLQVTDKFTGYADVFQLLQGQVAGLQITGMYPNISFSFRGSRRTPLFLLDGMPVEMDVIASVPVTEVDKVEVLKDIGNLALFGSRGSNGVISVFTKQGFIPSAKPVYHSVNRKVYGFYQARTFYAPKYDTPMPENQKPDLRATIFWAPNVITDANGNATVTFYNADKTTIINAETEGITGSGVPITARTTYEVK